MSEEKISRDLFLKLRTEEVKKMVNREGKPRSGIFVPDGTRRMILAISRKIPGSDNFVSEYLKLTSHYFMNNLKVFFSHGLQTLFVPLIGSHIFNNSKSPQHTALCKILETIFSGSDWLDFYKKNKIRVKVYGNLKYLESDEYAGVRREIENIGRSASANFCHTIFYGLAAGNKSGTDITDLSVEFFKKNGRKPVYRDLLESYYGDNVPPADFFIMSVKFAGLGALPPLIVNRETQVYFLPAPGLLALTRETYRKILFDLLFCRPKTSRREYEKTDLKYAHQLESYFEQNRSTVLGLGENIGDFWVPTIATSGNFNKKEA